MGAYFSVETCDETLWVYEKYIPHRCAYDDDIFEARCKQHPGLLELQRRWHKRFHTWEGLQYFEEKWGYKYGGPKEQERWLQQFTIPLCYYQLVREYSMEWIVPSDQLAAYIHPRKQLRKVGERSTDGYSGFTDPCREAMRELGSDMHAHAHRGREFEPFLESRGHTDWRERRDTANEIYDLPGPHLIKSGKH